MFVKILIKSVRNEHTVYGNEQQSEPVWIFV